MKIAQNWGLIYLEKRGHTIVTQSCKHLALRTIQRAHNPKVGGSNPSPATLNKTLSF
jgi:hypothetical protein